MKRIKFLVFIVLIYSCESKRFDNYMKKSNEFYSSGDCDNALKYVNKAIRINDKNEVAYNNRATFYLCFNEIDLALDDINKAIELNENYLQAYRNRANLNYRKEFYEKALKDLLIVYENNFNLEKTIKSLIFTTESMGKYTESLKYCNEYLEEYNDSSIYLNRAVSYLELSDFQKSISDIETYKKYNPDDVGINVVLGKVYNKQGNHSEAIKIYKNGLEKYPVDFELLYNLSYSFSELNKFDSAYYYSKLALKTKENNLIYFQLARIEEFRENYNYSIEYLNKAISLDSLDSKSYFYRGMNYALINKFKESYSDLENAFSLGYKDKKYTIEWWNENKEYLEERINEELK
jgi:tetratricopeptide (TPR) repeat protein